MQLHILTPYGLKNQLLTTRLYVSLYQRADKDYQRNYFHHYFRKTILFSKISENFKKQHFFEILGSRFTVIFEPFLRENGDKHDV